jgi:hypothetical protein
MAERGCSEVLRLPLRKVFFSELLGPFKAGPFRFGTLDGLDGTLSSCGSSGWPGRGGLVPAGATGASSGGVADSRNDDDVLDVEVEVDVEVAGARPGSPVVVGQPAPGQPAAGATTGAGVT